MAGMGEAAEILWRTAQSLASAGRLPPLLFVTDPQRTPDPAAVAARLPAGAGVIYRAFGAQDAPETAAILAAIARGRGLTLLIGLDEMLAENCGAHGLHLPERALAEAVGVRARHPEWRITGAAHGETGVAAAAAAGLDAVLLSPVFSSASLSAGEALGPTAFSRIARGAALPVYALGGVNAETAPRLAGSGACGIAAVDGVAAAFGHEKGR